MSGRHSRRALLGATVVGLRCWSQRSSDVKGRRLRGLRGDVTSLVFAGNRDSLLAGDMLRSDAAGAVHSLDIAREKVRAIVRLSLIHELDYLESDAVVLVSASQGRQGSKLRPGCIRAIELPDGGERRLFCAVESGATLFRFFLLPKRRQVVVSPNHRGERVVAELWDIDRGVMVKAFPRCADVVARDGSIAIDGDTSWLLDSGQMVARARIPRGSKSMVITGDGGYALSVFTGRSEPVIWETRGGNPVATLQRPLADLRRGAFDPAGRRLALVGAGGNGEAGVWDVKSGRKLTALETEAQLFAVAWSPDGTRLAAGGADGYLMVWDLPP
jgi:WD40 repeat protein